MHFEAPSRFRKGRLISIQKFSRKQKMNKYFVKKIRRLVVLCHEQDKTHVDYFVGQSSIRSTNLSIY